MVAISMYRSNLHLSGSDAGAPRRWELPRPALSAKRFRRLVRNRSLAVARLAGALPRPGSPGSTRLDGGDGAAEPAGDAPGVEAEEEEAGQEEQQDEGEGQQLQKHEEGEVEQEQQQEEEGVVEDADMDDAGEVVLEGDGNGDAEEGQGESEGVDPNQEVLNAEEEIRRRSILASLRAAMPQPSENAADGSSVSRLVPRMTVDVNFSDIAGDSDAGSNQGTPGRPLHHFQSLSPSTASFTRSPFGSLQHNSGHTPRSPATFSTASPSRFAVRGHQGHPPGPVLLPGSNYVASSPSPAASGGSSTVFRDSRPPNSM
ncbi:uncharacterized protein LOC133915679 isoform X2 [Phragmites australis]|uniref:uncharacterized protein LOC133915679 isoform X2 n=1 Tax=Phragmites australis TaxID=29695 RepID=UPI002D782F6D|nr:uncharacterized protein LOC133915679 isoform X2 [Phragmites australis]